MICYNHPERAAIGMCRHCQRGICMECAALVDDVLACHSRHEKHVGAANLAAAHLNLQAQRIGVGYARNGVFYGLVAIVFVGLGVSQIRFLGPQALSFILIGIFLSYASIANIFEARKYR
ncbi:MAG TPA: hypothetical protein VIU38_11580 [Anaerolineales bacterium]